MGSCGGRYTKFQGSKMHAMDFRKSCATLYYSYSAIPFFLLFMFVSFVNCIVAVFLGTSCRNLRVNRQSLRCAVYSVITLHFGPICGYVDSFETWFHVCFATDIISRQLTRSAALIVSLHPSSSGLSYDSTLNMLHKNALGLSTIVWREFKERIQSPKRTARVIL